jgi:glutathione S-transferase
MSSFEGYEVIYHAALTLRASQIQQLLTDLKVDFTMKGVDYGAEAKGENKVVGGKAEGVSVFAAPCLKQGDFVLSQTTAIMNYLCEKHGVSAELNTPEARAKAEQLLQDASDLQGEAYNISKTSDEEKAKFISERAVAFFKHLEKVCATTGKDSFLCGTTKPQACDYVLVTAMDTIKCGFGAKKLDETLSAGGFTALQGYYAMMTARDGYKAFLAKGLGNQLWEANCFQE